MKVTGYGIEEEHEHREICSYCSAMIKTGEVTVYVEYSKRETLALSSLLWEGLKPSGGEIHARCLDSFVQILRKLELT